MEKDFITVNIKEYLKLGNRGEEVLEKLFAEFECSKNEDVERFLLNQSIDFAKKNQSITYLVLNSINGKIVGYFTLAIKSITVNSDNFSKNICKKFARISEQNSNDGTYTMPAYLIAQLGKNFFRYSDNSITGDELLSIALDKIRTLQFQIGGVVVFLEAEPHEKLTAFYEINNGFKKFATRKNKNDTHMLVQLLKII